MAGGTEAAAASALLGRAGSAGKTALVLLLEAAARAKVEGEGGEVPWLRCVHRLVELPPALRKHTCGERLEVARLAEAWQSDDYEECSRCSTTSHPSTTPL